MTTPAEQFSVPIIPGQQTIHIDPYDHTPPPHKSRPWLVPLVSAIAALLVLVGGAALLFGFKGKDMGTTSAAATTAIARPLRLAHDACKAGEVSDGDRTLFLDTGGNKMNSGDANLGDLACILGQVSTPHYVVVRMEETRALDGRQTETWGPFEASWTYHPDQGLDVLIREK